MTFSGYVTDDPVLNQTIGRVAAASAVCDELLRTTLAGLTDVDFTYVLFEGQLTEQLSDSLRALLGEHYSDDPLDEDYRAIIGTLAHLKPLRQLRNIVVHGTWRRLPWAIDSNPLDRPWADQTNRGHPQPVHLRHQQVPEDVHSGMDYDFRYRRTCNSS